MNSLTHRRHWLQQSGMGFGSLALMHLLQKDAMAEGSAASHGVINPTHHTPTAKRVIYLFQAGGPSQLEIWDYKPLLNEQQGKPLPDSVRQGQRLTGMSGNQAVLPMAGSIFKFAQHGQCGTWASELMPHMAKQVDRITVIRSMYTEAINHDPAITFLQTGAQISGDHKRQGRPATVLATVGLRLPARPLSGSPVSIGKGTGAVPGQSTGHLQ